MSYLQGTVQHQEGKTSVLFAAMRIDGSTEALFTKTTEKPYKEMLALRQAICNEES
jgi:hypothetical protein